MARNSHAGAMTAVSSCPTTSQWKRCRCWRSSEPRWSVSGLVWGGHHCGDCADHEASIVDEKQVCPLNVAAALAYASLLCAGSMIGKDRG